MVNRKITRAETVRGRGPRKVEVRGRRGMMLMGLEEE